MSSSSSDTSPADGYMQTESKKHCYTSTASTPKENGGAGGSSGYESGNTKFKNHSLPMPPEFKENCGPKCVIYGAIFDINHKGHSVSNQPIFRKVKKLMSPIFFKF